MTATAISPRMVCVSDMGDKLSSRLDSMTPTTATTGVSSDECSGSPRSELSSLSASSVNLSPVTPPSQSPSQSPCSRSRLLSTPPEIMHRVLYDSGVDDLAALSRAAKTCRELRSFIYENPDQALWRDIHLQVFDDPKHAGAYPAPRQRDSHRSSAFDPVPTTGGPDVLGEREGDALSGEGGERAGLGGGRGGAWAPATAPEPGRWEIDYKKQVQDREFVRRVFQEWPKERYEELGNHLETIVSTLMSLYLDLPACPLPDPSTASAKATAISVFGTATAPSAPLPSSSSSSSVAPSASASRHPRRGWRASSPSGFAKDATLNGPLLETILRSDAFKHIYYNLSTRETRSLLRPLRGQPGNPNRRTHREVVHPDLSRLHLLLPPDFNHDEVAHRQHRGYLREVVYSQSNFQARNDWGPFTPDGKVDWTLLDAIGSVMMANAKDVLAMGEESWRHAVLPIYSYGLEPVRGWGFNDLRRPAGLAPGEVWDWAGVGGAWCGSYAFLDYSDWIALNEPRLVQFRRSMNQLDLSRYAEAVGDLMRLHLTVDGAPHDDSLGPLHSGSSSSTSSGTVSGGGSGGGGSPGQGADGLPAVTTSLPTSDLLPPIYFRGSSVQQHGGVTYPSQSPASFVRGAVRLTADHPPQVRWTLIIRYSGEDRWRLEGVQVGGRGSRRGFFGVWTDALKEEHSPNGPVWYWKP